MIIGIAGPTAGGKTTVAKMLEEEYDAVRLRYSNILSEMAVERGLDSDDKSTLQGLFLTERESRGEDFLTKEMEERVGRLDKDFIVIEGNRRLVDIDTLRRIANTRNDSLILLFIDASRETRYERYNERLVSRKEEPISFEEFIALEANDAEDEIDDLKRIFEKDGVVMNTDNQNADEVFTEIKALIETEKSTSSGN